MSNWWRWFRPRLFLFASLALLARMVVEPSLVRASDFLWSWPLIFAYLSVKGISDLVLEIKSSKRAE